MLLGKANIDINDISNADKEMQEGLPVVKNAFGEHSVRYHCTTGILSCA